MRIQYISDLHLENFSNYSFVKANLIEPLAERLILVGDIVPIGNINDVDFFWDHLSLSFKEVYWVPGNQEFYGVDYNSYRSDYCEKIRKNIFLVNNRAIIIEDKEFIFSTLWSCIPENLRWFVQIYINDFKSIRYNNDHIDIYDYNMFHQESLRFIKSRLTDADYKDKVVVTHHCPIMFDDHCLGIRKELLNAYCSDLVNVIKEYSPIAWLYGHTHVSSDNQIVGSTRCLTNQFDINLNTISVNVIDI